MLNKLHAQQKEKSVIRAKGWMPLLKSGKVMTGRINNQNDVWTLKWKNGKFITHGVQPPPKDMAGFANMILGTSAWDFIEPSEEKAFFIKNCGVCNYNEEIDAENPSVKKQPVEKPHELIHLTPDKKYELDYSELKAISKKPGGINKYCEWGKDGKLHLKMPVQIEK
jgi:hypothetical protein